VGAKERAVDVVGLGGGFVPELASAGFLRPFTDAEAKPLTEGVLKGSVTTSTWKGKLVAAPFWANTQLLWYRKSVAQKAGLDPAKTPVTWDQIIKAAQQTHTTVQVTGALYEG